MLVAQFSRKVRSMRRNSLTTWFFLFALSCHGQPSATSHESLRASIAILSPADVCILETPIDVTGAEMGASTSGAENSWPSLLSLWFSGQESHVKLLWWEQDDPETRALIVALFWKRIAPPAGRRLWTSGMTDFETMAKRFAEGEREQRLREIAFVRANLPAIRADLDALFRRVEEVQRQHSKLPTSVPKNESKAK